MSLVVTRPKRELAPEGVHRAYVAQIEAVDHEEYGPRIQFSFDLKDLHQEDGEPIRVFRSCSAKLTPKAALTGVVQDVLGRPLSKEEAEDGFDLEGLVGYPVQIVVKHKMSTTGNAYCVVETIIHLDEPKRDDLPF